MNEPKLWELWYAKVKFEETDGYKDRPVLVTGTGEVLVLAVMITSTGQRSVWGEYDIVFWKSAGLAHPSTVRCTRKLKLERHDFRRKIGDLHPTDILNICKYL